MPRPLPWMIVGLFFMSGSAWAGAKAPPQPAEKTVEQLAEASKPSVAVILYTGRDGRQQGIGSGFVVGDGLIATNFHVIGEARPITVQMPDGTKHEVTAVHASDRNLDLAIVRVQGKNWKALPLGQSKHLKIGQPLIALGHPRGLEHSVVSGVLSGQREVEGIAMLQLAIPIEQGNSGGPVMDMEGRVVGIVTMKSLVTANLGFAVPIDALKPLLAKPNPIPMERWLTIGALDKSEWKALAGGRWRQRAGRILADGVGTGFGGRTYCYYQRPVPREQFEAAVTVKLDQEAGAAGLIFGGDGGDKHFGFYPSGGKLRFTHFQGPDVLTWKILHDGPSPHYRPGDWNTLKVRVDKDRVKCYVNDGLVFEAENLDMAGPRVGLARFRDTVAEFKQFQVGDRIAGGRLTDQAKALIAKSVRELNPDKEPSAREVESFLKFPEGTLEELRIQARRLEKQAAQLRKIAQAVHHQKVIEDLTKLAKEPEDRLDLIQGALLLARLDNEEVDIAGYRKEVDRLARDIASGLPKGANDQARLTGLIKALFEERGFHGSRLDYYSRNNSYLNEVIDDREGLPITLSVLFMELARRLDLKVVGVALPGHFVTRHEPSKGPSQLIDVYEGGKFLTVEQAQDKVRKITGRPPRDQDLAAATKRFILLRMTHNLLNAAQEERDQAGSLRYLDAILAIDPEAHEERWVRAVFRYQAGQREGALADCEAILAASPPNVDLERVRELRKLVGPN